MMNLKAAGIANRTHIGAFSFPFYSLLFLMLLGANTAQGQVIFYEDFDNIGGPTAGGAGTYSFPSGWLLRNVDNLTPNAAVAYIDAAWERREDFSMNVSDSVAFSTSWYTPGGIADDWMWTPLIGPITGNSLLSWNALAYDPAFKDGYEVRVMVAPNVPTGGSGAIGNQLTQSTQIFSIAEENSSWTSRSVSLAAFAGQTIYIGFRNHSDDKFILVIDDIKVENINAFDVTMFSITQPSPFSTIPEIMNYPLTLQGTMKNIGLNTVNNPQEQIKITNSMSTVLLDNTTTGGVATLAPNATVQKSLPDYVAPGAGVYAVEYITKINESDQNTANDTLRSTFTISDTTYARDNGVITSTLGIGAGVTGYLGSEYPITNTSALNSVSMYMTLLNSPGKYGIAVYKKQNGTPGMQLYNSPQYTSGGITDSMLVIPLTTPLLLNPLDTIVVCAVEYDSTLTIGNTNEKFTPGTQWVNWTGTPLGGWGNTEAFGATFAKSLVIRANFAPPTALVALSPATQTICSASNVSIDATPTPSTSTVAWTRNENVNVTGLPASGTGDVNGSLVNNTNADITVTFIFTPTFNGNPGEPDTAYVTVRPNPVINSVIVNQPVFPSTMGSIVVNATGSGSLVYSLNSGPTQPSNTFANLSSGSYNIAVSYDNAPNCAIAYASNPVSINGSTYRKSNIVAGASPFQDSMWLVDLENLIIVKRLAPSMPGFTITGINGLATHPITGEHYAIVKVSGISGRLLTKINFSTGVCTTIGNLGDNFASISFRDDGQLFGVTGNGATVPETLYLIDHTTGVKTLATALGNGADGEVILHIPESNAFYHWSGNGTVVFETVADTPPYIVTNIPITGTTSGETFGALYLGGGDILISNISSEFEIWDTAGVIKNNSLMNLPDDLRGLIQKCCNSSLAAVGSGILCGDPVTLQVTGGESNFQWYFNGSMIPGANGSTYSALSPGLYNCIYTDSCGIRDSVSLGVQLIAGNTATADAGGDDRICASQATYSLNGAVGGSVTGGTWSTSGSGTFSPSANALNATYTFSAADTAANVVTLYLTTDDPAGACLPDVDSIIITIDPESIINAGPDQTVCAADTLFLHATLSGVATNMVWQLNAAFGSFVGPDTSPDAKFVLNANGMAQSSISFGAMSNDPGSNVCQGGVDTVVFFINPKATANAGADARICASQKTLALNGSFGGSATSASWSTSGSGTFAPNVNTLNAVYTFSAADTMANQVDLILSTNDPTGLCGPAKDTLHVIIDPESIINAGPDQTVCASDTLFLHATLSGVATNMVWQLNAAFGSFVGPDTSPDAKFVLNANGMAQSSISFGAMSNDPGSNVCQGGVDTVVFFINPKATANAGADARICASQKTLALNGSFGGAATAASWTTTGTGTFAPNANTLNAVYTFSAADTMANQVNLILTTNDPTGLCGPAKDTLHVIIDPESIINAGPDQTVCASDTLFLHATLSGVATNMVWQLNAAFGSFVGPDTSPDAKFVLNANGMAQSSISFGAMSNDPGSNVCQGGVDTVVFFINQPATVDAGANQTICSSTPTVNLTGTIGGTASTVTWSGGSGSFSNPTSINTTYTIGAADITAGTVKLFLTSNDPSGPCKAARDSVIITIQRAATVNAGPDQQLCSNSPVISLAGSIGGSASSSTWMAPPLGGIFSPSNQAVTSYTPTVAEINSGSITFTLVTNDPPGVCPAVSDVMVVLVNPVPNAVANPSSQVSCSEQPITTIALSGNVAGTVYTWTRNNTAVTGMATSGTGNISGTLVNAGLVPELVTFTITPSFTRNGFTCTGTAITATVTVNPKPLVNTIANQLVCANTLTSAVSYSGAPPTAFFTWTNSSPSIGLAASGIGNIPAFTAQNNTGVDIVATITVTPNYTNGNVTCQGTPRTFTITVFPVLLITPKPDVEICEDAAFQLGVNLTQLGTPPYAYNWTGPSGFTSTLAAPIIGPSVWNVHTGAYNVTVTDSKGCTGLTTQDVIVNPSPSIIIQPQDMFVCEGNTGTVSCLASVANGSPLSYILQQQAGQSWTTLATNATGSFTVNNATPAMNGTVYRILAHADHNPMPDCETSSQLFQLFVHDDQGLACNDMVNYSIDENCEGLITVDMIMEGDFVDEFYVITLVNAGGQPVPNPIGQQYIGEILTATVLDICTGNSCTGNIRIEDKLPPIVTCDQPMCDLLDLSGEWDATDNSFSPGACWAFDGFTPNPNVLYDVLQFTVAVAGDYTFTMDDSPNYDGIAGIFDGSFDANDPCANLIGGDDDINGIFETEPSFTINLQPGTYYLVSSTWTSGQMGVYNWTFSGPAPLMTPCDFTCLDKEGILNGDIELPEPTVFDCSDYTVTPNVSITGDECDGETIHIVYLVKDKFGYQSSCSQHIAIQPLSIDDVLYPVSPAILTCNAGTTPLEISNYFEDVSYGYPYVINFLGDALPIDNNTCNIYATYHDAVIAACGAACLGNSKIVRTWTLLDWCTLETANYVQIIKAVDTKAPTFIVKDVTVSVNPWGCVANFQAPMPWELQDNCDAHPVWWLEGPAGVVITSNPTDGYFVTGAPKGTHAFTYKAVDCCGNIGSAVAYITVIDRSAPVAVAKQNIVISLTGSGTAGDGAAKLYAWMVDNGSYDHCTAVKLEIRRPDGTPDCGNLGVDDHNNNVTFDDDDSASPQVRWAHPNDSRDDTDNGAFVKFCCEDLGSEISVVHQVTMRVWDDGNMNGVIGDNLIINGMQDNYNETWADIRVENKIPPVLVCPLDATITCDMELNLSTTWKSVEGVNLTMTGGPAVAYDLCNGIGVEYKDTPSWTNTCENVGRIRREFRAVKGDKTVNCYQTITVNALPSTFVVTPPSSSVLDAPCDFNESDIKASDKPKVQGGPCDVIGENIHIDTFLFEDGVCKKWKVTYNYINWCTGEQKGPYTKYYKFKDDEKPVLTCQDQMFAANPNPQNPNGNCEGTVNLEATATDGGGCSANGWLKWQVFVDLWGNGTVDLEYSSFLPTTDNNINNDTNNNGIKDRYVAPTASGGVLKVPAFVMDAENSVHKVQWKVTDGCGNVTDCYSTFMVVDKKAPTPYCLSLSSAVMQNGQVELWAIDFDKGSFDNCTPKNALMFTFNGEFPVWTRITEEHYFKGAGLSATVAEYNAGNAQKWVPGYRSSAMIFNCDDVEASPITLNMSVWDARQNTDFCSVELTLIDNQGGCGGSRMMVAGDIKTEKGLGVKNADVILRSNQAGMEKQRLTDGNGDYVFGDLPVMVDYHVTGKKRDDWMNGVSTLDLVMMQRHILGLAPFHNGYKMVAADVNNDSKVSASDMVVLRKLILGLITELPNNDSWRFLDAQTPIANPDNPWPLDEEIVIESVDHDMMDQHLMGVKVGDVTQDASASGIIAETRSDKVAQLVTENINVSQGDLVTIPFRISDLTSLAGVQFTMKFKNLEFVTIQSGKLEITELNYGIHSNDMLTFSWSSHDAIACFDSDILFSVVVKARSGGRMGEMITLGSWITSAEGYDAGNATYRINLKHVSTDTEGAFALLQNEPNPFKSSTRIGIVLPAQEQIKLQICDVTGRVVYRKELDGKRGINHLEVTKNELQGTGIYYYTVIAGEKSATKSFVILD